MHERHQHSFDLSEVPECNPFMHQRELSHAVPIRDNTSSQRRAASFNARSQRSPAAIPRSGSRLRKTDRCSLRQRESRAERMPAHYHGLAAARTEWLKRNPVPSRSIGARRYRHGSLALAAASIGEHKRRPCAGARLPGGEHHASSSPASAVTAPLASISSRAIALRIVWR